MAEEALVLRGLVKTFGVTRALDGANLVVGRGTIHGLIGQNGAANPRSSRSSMAFIAPMRAALRSAARRHITSPRA